jgi:predicted amidophosphoribosyltransferase
VLSALRYDDHAAGFIVAYKDGGAWQLTGLLGGLLLNCWRVLDPPGRNVIVPLPSHPATVRHRGFDHTLTLARWLAKKTGATASPLLRKVRRDPDQVSLSGSARAAKPQHSMAATSGPTAPLILIDDVLTTGGTAAEAIRALSAAHHRIRAVLVIAERE